MKIVVQSTGKGTLSVVEVPAPRPGPTDVLVETRRSLVSSGTERALRELAQASLIKKAKARPDLVKQVLNKVRTDGLRSTLGAVRDKMDAVTPLGYSAAGVVVESGECAPLLAPGTRVATASVGHAEMQVVPGLLAVPIPDDVSDSEAAFGAVAAIAMHGLHQAGVQLGDTVVVAGLGLVGQLTSRLAVAAGLRVIGIDLNSDVADMARDHGAHALLEQGSLTTSRIHDLLGGRLADAVLVTASTPSSDPVTLACERVRDRGRVVVVGDVGLTLDRTPFYLKEVDLKFARSYGPGRYDPRFEEQALDYPVGYVPRTQRTNIAAYLDLVSRKRLVVDDLVSRTFSIEDAEAAYAALGSNREVLAIQFTYPGLGVDSSTLRLSDSPNRAGSVALVGAGDFVRSTLLPAMKSTGWGDVAVMASATGLSASSMAAKAGISEVTTDIEAIANRPAVGTVFVATRHDSHSDLVSKFLDSGKNVFCEKPLAIDEEGLTRVVDSLSRSEGMLWVGFNRRYSEAVRRARAALGDGSGALSVHYRVAAGPLPEGHWLKDVRQGGRMIGEVCHFVDTASWVIGSDPRHVHARGRSRVSAALQEDVTLLVSYPDGSTATIEYVTDAHRSTPKERIEILGRGHTIVIDDFTNLTVDGRDVKLQVPDKGHTAGLAEFKAAVSRVSGGQADHLQTTLSTTSAMFAAVRSLASGEVAYVETMHVRQ